MKIISLDQNFTLRIGVNATLLHLLNQICHYHQNAVTHHT